MMMTMSRTAIQRQSPGVEFVYIYIYIYMCTRLYGKRKGERERNGRWRARIWRSRSSRINREELLPRHIIKRLIGILPLILQQQTFYSCSANCVHHHASFNVRLKCIDWLPGLWEPSYQSKWDVLWARDEVAYSHVPLFASIIKCIEQNEEYTA